MIDAHMDELGGMVRRVTPSGLLTMQMLGGWLDQALVDQRWIIIGSKGPVRAVTGIRDVHVVPAEERARVFSRDRSFSTSARRARPKSPLWASAPVIRSFRCSLYVMNGTDNYLSKAWDDRVGCGVVIEAMRRLATSRMRISFSDDHDSGGNWTSGERKPRPTL